MRRRVTPANGEATASPLYSLTSRQVYLLIEASERMPRGLYVPVMGLLGAKELVAGGAAEYREEPQTSTTPRSVSDPTPCRWTDYYLVPTARGLDLLEAYDDRVFKRT